MKIHFGLTYDESYTPLSTSTEGGVYYVGPNGLLRLLESQCGIPVPADNVEHLRIEWYRQAIQRYLEIHPDPFFKNSFRTDQLAVATALLERRDELFLSIRPAFTSKPRFPDLEQFQDRMPDRIQTLFELELFYQLLTPPPGFAERLIQVEIILPGRDIQFTELLLNESKELLPYYWQRILTIAEQMGVLVTEKHRPGAFDQSITTDLQAIKSALTGKDSEKVRARGDGSVMVLRFGREPDAATWFSKILRLNPGYHPVLLLPEKNRILDNALNQEGLPCMGLLSASTARPSLQILRLITAFLWKPLDPNKVLEFTHLALKPLDQKLGKVISELISASPGTHSEKWHFRIARFFEESTEASLTDTTIEVDKIRREYEFWFERPRFEQENRVPVSEVFDLFDYLKRWAGKTYQLNPSKNNSLLSLKEQCDQILELLEALPDTEPDLSPLELERLIRTIYKPSPVLYRKRQSGALDFIYQPSSLLHAVDDLVWWNFTETEAPFFFSKWYPQEFSWMQSQGMLVATPARENQLLLWQRIQPFLQTKKRILLVIPELVDGDSVNPHPLWANLEGFFSDIGRLIFYPSREEDGLRLQDYFNVPGEVELPPLALEKPGPFLRLPEKYRVSKRDYETFSSIESLLYYPHQWVFKYYLRLKKSPILQVQDENTLYGNLSHRIFELLLKEDFLPWNRQQVYAWVEHRGQRIIESEGATLMLYGLEPERVNFLNKVKSAAWNLISTLRNNEWKVLATELDLDGHFGETTVKAKADLVLQKGNEYAVLDLKWMGEGYRTNLIKNEEDIQLVMYSRLVPPLETWMHTAYFIISKGRLILRNNAAFTDIPAIRTDSNLQEVHDRIWDKMLKTWHWRNGQLEQGMIEIRATHTERELEEVYENQLWELLEMKKGDSKYDDFKVLLGMVE